MWKAVSRIVGDLTTGNGLVSSIVMLCQFCTLV